jgi:O-antigen ligase
MLACVLTASLPFAIALSEPATGHTGRGGVEGWRAAAAVMIAAAAFTFSHAIAGLAVAVLLSAWPAFAPWPRLRRLAVAGVVLIALALNFAATASIRSVSSDESRYSDATQHHYAVDQREMAIGNVSIVYNVMSYFRIKQVAWRAFVEHPIAGVGLDQFHGETRRAFDEGRLTEPYREIDPHSTVPGRFAETGLIGGATLLFLWMVWSQMAVAAARSRPIGLAAAAAFAGLIVSSVNADIMNFRFLWVIAGLMRGLHEANGISIASGRGADSKMGAA